MPMSEVQAHPLFTGLTRPAMIFGVTVDYLSFSAMVAMCAFIMTSSVFAALIFIPLHVVGWIGCQFDHHIVRLLSTALTCRPVPNKRLWGCQSYAAV